MKTLAFSGHLTDAPGRASPRFPEPRTRAVAVAVRAKLKELRPERVIGSAARGADLIVLEAARSLGVPTEIVLPFAPQDFAALSVLQPDCPEWTQRFEAALANADKLWTLSGTRREAEALSFELANRVILGRLAECSEDGVDSGILAVWDGRPGDGAGGTASFLALARDAGFDGAVARLENAAAKLSWAVSTELEAGRSAAQADDYRIAFEVAVPADATALRGVGGQSLLARAIDAEAALGARLRASARPVVCRIEAWPYAPLTGGDERALVSAVAALERRLA